MYSFDPVGSYEREACRAAGAAQSLVQPFLDNQVSSHPSFRTSQRTNRISLQIYFKNQTPASGASFPQHLPLSTVLSLVIDSFTGATERHIEVCFYHSSHHFRGKVYDFPRLTLRYLCLSCFALLFCRLNIYAHGVSLLRLETV